MKKLKKIPVYEFEVSNRYGVAKVVVTQRPRDLPIVEPIGFILQEVEDESATDEK